MIKPQYQQWPFPFQNMETFVVPPQDELLVYKWEGFGRPNSTSGKGPSIKDIRFLGPFFVLLWSSEYKCCTIINI